MLFSHFSCAFFPSFTGKTCDNLDGDFKQPFLCDGSNGWVAKAPEEFNGQPCASDGACSDPICCHRFFFLFTFHSGSGSESDFVGWGWLELQLLCAGILRTALGCFFPKLENFIKPFLHRRGEVRGGWDGGQAIA